MLGAIGTPCGRLILGIVGIALLWTGAMQLSAAGIVVMMTGLIITVAAAISPAGLVTLRTSRAVPVLVRTTERRR
jgi:hypothetical protein